MISDDQGIEDAFEEMTTQLLEKTGSQNTEIKQMAEQLGGQNTEIKQMAEQLASQNTEIKQMAEQLGGQNTQVKESVEGLTVLTEVIDGMKQSDGEKTAELHRTVDWLKQLEKVVLNFDTGIASISLRQGVRGSLAEWSKNLVEKIAGTQNTGLEELKGVVQQMKVDSTGKQEVFVKAVGKMMNAVNEMKEKSSNAEKVKTP